MPAVHAPENRDTPVLRDLPFLSSPERVQELLFEAARLGREEVIPVLLEAGADIEAADARGHTALVLATYNGFDATTELPLDHGGGPNGTTASGSPLTGVPFKGHVAIARQLLAAGADPNLRNAAGQTAIMMSGLLDRRDIIALLLDAGADLHAVDAAGNDAAGLGHPGQRKPRAVFRRASGERLIGIATLGAPESSALKSIERSDTYGRRFNWPGFEWEPARAERRGCAMRDRA